MVKVLLCIRMKIKLSFHMFWHWFALLFISPTFLSIVSYIRIRIFSFPNRCLRILNLLLLCFHVAISSLIEFFTISFFLDSLMSSMWWASQQGGYIVAKESFFIIFISLFLQQDTILILDIFFCSLVVKTILNITWSLWFDLMISYKITSFSIILYPFWWHINLEVWICFMQCSVE